MVLNVIHVYAVYTLIEELEEQRCACAVEDNKNLHNIFFFATHWLQHIEHSLL